MDCTQGNRVMIGSHGYIPLFTGRTGRAGRLGKAVTFFTEDDTANLRR